MNDNDKKKYSKSPLEVIGSVASFGVDVALEAVTCSMDAASCCGEVVCEVIGSIDLDI